jgi:C4-type Zn-finger protein
MSKVVHYRVSGELAFCYHSGPTSHEVAIADEQAGRVTTDIRRVTCPLCLHAMAASMIRKGVPIKFTPAGVAFCKQNLEVPKATRPPAPKHEAKPLAKCRCCGGRSVERIILREGDRERVIVQCRSCEQRRGEYTRNAKKHGGAT